MLSYFMNLFLGDISKEILIVCSFFGYIFFFLYFHGTTKWDKFSEIDKIFLSLLFGFIAFYLLLHPLYNIFTVTYNFIFFTGENGITTSLPNESTYKLGFMFILGLLLGARKEVKKPLFDCTHCHVYFIVLMQNLFTAIFFVSLLLVPIVLLNEYSIYFPFVLSHFLGGIVKIYFLYWIYLTVFIESTNTQFYKNTYLYKKIIKFTKAKILVSATILIILILAGTFFLKPDISENNYEIEIHMDSLSVDHPLHRISAEKRIYQDYTIKPPIVLNWVGVNTNHEVLQAYKNIDGKKENYFVNNNYFIVNESHETNVTAILSDEITLSNELHLEKILPKYENEIEYCEINIQNNISGELHLNYIDLYLEKNYEPIEVITNYTTNEREYSYSWTKNNSNFDDLFYLFGDFLFIKCDKLKENESVEIYVTLEKKIP